MKPISFTRLEVFKQCPRKYKYKYVDKVEPEQQDFAALVKGRAIHAILESYPERTSHKGAERYQKFIEPFINSELGRGYLGIKHVSEVKIGLDDNLEPVSYDDKKAIFRGIVDYTAIHGILNIIDFKTGKFKEQCYQSYDQLIFYAIYFFKRYKHIDKIRISFVYVEHVLENDLILERKYLDVYMSELLKSISNLRTESVFPTAKGKLCSWCDFKEHCSKNDINK